MSLIDNIESCPVEIAMSIVGKKWTIHILRDMFRGVTRFSDFLNLNPKMSTRVLSQRLKELQNHKMVERIVLNQTPIHIEYHLTEKGLAFHETIISLSKFSITKYPEKIFANVEVTQDIKNEAIEIAAGRFSVISNSADYK